MCMCVCVLYNPPSASPLTYLVNAGGAGLPEVARLRVEGVLLRVVKGKLETEGGLCKRKQDRVHSSERSAGVGGCGFVVCVSKQGKRSFLQRGVERLLAWGQGREGRADERR